MAEEGNGEDKADGKGEGALSQPIATTIIT